jgi:hypothetical protein
LVEKVTAKKMENPLLLMPAIDIQIHRRKQ